VLSGEPARAVRGRLATAGPVLGVALGGWV
jgi:hypothetical protein